MKFNDSFQHLQHSWHDICSVFYARYPNPHSKHVLGEDIVQRVLGPDRILKTTRIFAKTNEVPGWLRKFLPTTTVYIVEESHIDIPNNVITTYSRNITHNTLLSVEERSVFTVDRDNRELTKVERRAWIESFFIGLSPVFERFGLARYKSNIQRMHQGFSSVLNSDNTTGATSVMRSSSRNSGGLLNQPDIPLTKGIKSAL